MSDVLPIRKKLYPEEATRQGCPDDKPWPGYRHDLCDCPMRPRWWESEFWVRHPLTVVCPTCKANVGDYCHTPRKATHFSRFKLAKLNPLPVAPVEGV